MACIMAKHILIWTVLCTTLCPMKVTPINFAMHVGVVDEAGGAHAPYWSNAFEAASSYISVEYDDIRQFPIVLHALACGAELSFKNITKIREAIGAHNITLLVGAFNENALVAARSFQIVYIVTTAIAYVPAPHTNLIQPSNDIIEMRPSDHVIAEIAVSLVESYRWSAVCVIYDNPKGVLLIESMVRRGISVSSWRIKPDEGQSELIRNELLSLRELGQSNFIVSCEDAMVSMILVQALRLSMITSHYTWILPVLDDENFNLQPYVYTSVNFALLRFIQDYRFAKRRQSVTARLDLCIAFDTLRLALSLHTHASQRNATTTGISSGLVWPLLADVLKVKFEGLTGRVEFDAERKRPYLIDVLSLDYEGLENIALWNSSAAPTKRLRYWPGQRRRPKLPSPEFPLGKDLIRIVTIIEPPFVQLKSDHATRIGNDRFEGFCIDLVDRLSQMLNFEYRMYLVPDGKFGEIQENGTWNGIIGELEDGSAHMAVASLTITAEREGVIDFTKPYMTIGITIVMKRQQETPSYFQFLMPLSKWVWLSMIVAFILVSLIIYTMDRCLPAEHRSNEFNLVESFLFIFGALVQGGTGGTDNFPRTYSSRILIGVWWFCCLIIISSYTANLAAYKICNTVLTMKKFHGAIHDVTDLAQQSKVKYGTVRSSQVSAFFRTSKLENFQKMWTQMSTLNVDTMVNSSNDGFRRVLESDYDYAFLWESPVIKFETIMNCNLVEIGHPFDSKGYGIGLPQGSMYRDEISLAILRLNEEGELSRWEKRWWPEMQCSNNAGSKVGGGSKELDVQTMSGVFFFLVCGVALSVAVCIGEMCYNQRTKRSDVSIGRDEPIKPCEEIIRSAILGQRYANGVHCSPQRCVLCQQLNPTNNIVLDTGEGSPLGNLPVGGSVGHPLTQRVTVSLRRCPGYAEEVT